MDALFSDLAAAQEAYLSAKQLLDASVARQQELAVTLATADEKTAEIAAAVSDLAHQAYVSAGYMQVAVILSSDSPGEFLEVMTIGNAMRTNQDNKLHALRDAVAEANAIQASIDAEVVQQQAAVVEMDARKREAENALWSVGSGGEAPGFASTSSVIADPAPRKGDWAPEEQTVWEPNTSNYITPRTAHGRDEAIKAGFTHYVSCYYYSTWGQHPLGRACDFAVDECRFCGDVYGADQQYGTDLTAFFVFNADRLGVLYVIWYQQIWTLSSGWSYYNGCCTASERHTNHVHVSFY